MNQRPFTASSTLFASLASLLVALGTQTLIENINFLSLFDLLSSPGTVVFQFIEESRWRSHTAIRFVSFAAGGAIAVLLARGKSRRLIGSIFAVAAVATVFSQFPILVGLPSQALLIPMALWSLAAPIGGVLGAWLVGRNRVAYG